MHHLMFILSSNLVGRYRGWAAQGLENTDMGCQPEIYRKRGEETSPYEVQEACKRKAIYADWLNATVLGSSGFNTIMVYPVGDIAPFYRDTYRK